MVAARMAFVATDWEPVVECALGAWESVPAALSLLRVLGPDRIERFAPVLLPMALFEHGQILAVRELIAALGDGWMSANARGIVEETISAPAATWESVRRLAELLDHLREDELLRVVVDAARESDDPDIAEVADDFG